MKMQVNKRMLAAMAILGTAWLGSCQKDTSTDAAPVTIESVAAASDEETVQESVSQEIFNDVSGIDDLTAGEDLGIYGLSGGGIFTNEPAGSGANTVYEPTVRCYTVNVEPRDPGVFPKTVTIDFGTGCEVRGHIRKGKIIIVYSGRLHRPGSSAVTKFDNFYIDQFKVEGEHTVKNISTPGSNFRVFTRQIVDGKITNTEKGTWCTWNVFHTIKQIEGNGTPFYPKDDMFTVTGVKKVECSDGRTRTAEIMEPLLRKFGCHWFIMGTVKLTLNGTVGTLDYGDGTCDNTATITVNGETRTITMR